MKTRRMNRNRLASHLRIATAVSLVAGSTVCAFFALPLNSTGSSTPAAYPKVMSGSQWGRPLTTIVGGATVLRTTQTVQHWFGSTLDPQNGVTYGYNIVGADPNNCSGPDCDVTITVDIIPLNAIVAGESFNGTEVVAATLASPVFALNDYGFTSFVTVPGAFRMILSSSKAWVGSSHRTMQAINFSFRTLSSGRSSTRRARVLTT